MNQEAKFGKIELNEEDKKIVENNRPIFKRKLSKIISGARKLSKKDKCMICGEEVEGFCNSHNIPAFCLRTIAKEGKLYTAGKLTQVPFMEYEKGVNNAGTFHLICNKCDSTFFQTYENPENYNGTINGKMLAEIAMKNYLKQISKRNIELEMPKSSRNLELFYPYEIEKKYAEPKKLDLKEYMFCFEKAKRLTKKPDNNDYYLFSRITLDYTVPIAFQGTVALISDLEGRIINNIYSTNSNFKIAYLHICIFPFDDKTEIFLFTESVDKRYRRFYKSFRKLPLEDQLSIINYIIFLYTEDYFLSMYVSENVFLDEKLREIVIGLSDAIVPTEDYNLLDEAKEKFDLRKHKSIINLLLYEYSIQNSKRK